VPSGVSADGSAIVGWGKFSNFLEGLIWTQKGAVAGLGFLPGGNSSVANGVNANGTVVVGSANTPGFNHAFSWTPSGGMVDLGLLLASTDSWASGVSADGSVVVGSSGNQAFTWSAPTGMVGLGFLPGWNGSAASGVSADGKVVVGSSNGPIQGGRSQSHAFRWTASTGMVDLGIFPYGNYSFASATSANGDVVVGYADTFIVVCGVTYGDLQEAFRWTAATGIVGLGFLTPQPSYSVAAATNSDGNVVVGVSQSATGRHPFWWSPNTGMLDLEDLVPGFFLPGADNYATGVSADGTEIVGYGPAGGQLWTAWLVSLPQKFANGGDPHVPPSLEGHATSKPAKKCG
jgi:probable HAF family extracellular repeat protein